MCNIGISILKIIACFYVVDIHEGLGIRGNTFAVPIFMTMAFYLSAKTVYEAERCKLKQRMLRIVVPLWAWSSLALALPTMPGGSKIDGVAVLLQMLLGHAYLRSLWFLPCLAGLTLVFYALARIGTRRFDFVCIVLAVCAIGLQYSCVPSLLKQLPGELSWPLGRFIEMFPCAAFGLVLARHAPVDNPLAVLWCTARVKVAMLVAVVCLCLVSMLIPRPDGFLYQGVAHSVIPVAVVFLFACVGAVVSFPRRMEAVVQPGRDARPARPRSRGTRDPTECAEGFATTSIDLVARLTPGVYYSHEVVGWLMPIERGLLKTCCCAGLCGLLAYAMQKVPYVRRLFS